MQKTIISTIILIVCGACVFAQNALKNGDFEQKFKEWSHPYWEKKPMPGNVVSDVVYGGKGAFLFHLEGDKENYIYSPLNFNSWKSCRIKLAVKSEDAPENDLYVSLMLYKKDPKTGKNVPAGMAWRANAGQKLLETGGTHDWKEIEFKLDPANFNSEHTGAALFIHRKNNSKGKIYIDELVVEPVEAKPKPDSAKKGGISAFFFPAPNLWPSDSSFETETGGFSLPRDFNQAFHGSASLRMNSGSTSASSRNMFLMMKPKKKYTFSFYVKADRPVEMATHAITDHWSHVGNRSFQADTEWKKIDVSYTPQSRNTGLNFSFQKPENATVWLDAFQFNEGDAAPYVAEAALALGMDSVEPVGQLLFRSPEKLERAMSVRNNGTISRNVKIRAELEPVFEGKKELFSFEKELKPGEVFSKELVLLPERKIGYYVVRITAESGKDRAEYNLPFMIAEKPLPMSETSFFGLHFGEFGKNIGVSWYRPFRFWQFWKRDANGEYVVNLDRKEEMRRMETINIAHPPENLKKGIYTTDSEIDRFVIALVRGMKGSTHYIEIENEPDLTFPTIYGKGIEFGAERYAEHVNRLAKKILEIDPKAKIMASGVSGVDFNTHFPFTEKVLENAGKNIDILPVHPYSSSRYLSADRSDVGPELNRVYAKTLDLKQRVKKHGENQELWFGEIGWALDVTEDYLSESALRHAAYMLRLMLIGKAAGVKKVIYFTGDHCVERERYHYGIWRSGKPLPAAAAYAALAHLLEGAEEMEVLANNDIHCFTFRHRDGGTFAALWLSTDASANVTIALPSTDITVRNMFGSPVPLSGGQLQLKASGNPLYLFAGKIPYAEFKDKLLKAQYDLPPLKATWRLKKADLLHLQLENIRTQKQSGTLNITGADFRNPGRTFVLNAGDSAEFEFKTNASLNRKEIRLAVSGNAGEYKSSYRAEILGCPEATQNPASEETALPEKGRLPVMDSRKHLMPNDPGNGWNGPENLSVESAISYDMENLYLLVNVRDNVHFQQKKPGILWSSDSIQLAIDSKANALPDVHGFDKDDYEFGFGLTPVGAQKELTYLYEVGRTKQALDSVGCHIFRKGDLTCYRIAIPWKTLKLVPEKGMIFGLNFVANDDDGHGKRFWMGVTHGIVETKNPYAYRKFVLE